MGNPCADKLLKSSKPLHDRIKEMAGNVEYDDNPKAWKDAARKLQSQNLDQLNNIYADNNVGGYKKIELPPSDTTPKGNTSNVGGDVGGNGIKLQGSPREIIKELKGRKGDKAIHAGIFQNNGYNVFIYDNNKILVDKTFKTHEEAKEYLNDWSSKNGKDNQSKYDYGTIEDIANLPYRQEITGNLPKDFIDKYKEKVPPFGFNGLGEFVFLRTYSRLKEDGKNETWWETVRRVVEGIYSIQKQHIEDYGLGWNQMKAQKSAQEMFDRIYNFKMLPAGRSLWTMGSPVIMEKGLTQALYNCSFISTENIKEDPGKPFANAMDFLMCGIGVGSDTAGSDKVKVKEPGNKTHTFQIPDTREGWVEALYKVVNSFFGGDEILFDYSLVRAAGLPIKTFGGTSSGPDPLKELLENVRQILTKNIGNNLSTRNITDIFNLIGKCVIAGNVRRSAEIILGDPTEEFLDLKNYDKNPDRAEYGWASNNSIFAKHGMDYSEISQRIQRWGEPGVYWLDNAQKYGRMIETESNYKDFRVRGLNPCAEINLESGELCNLVETFPNNHESFDDYSITIKYAYLYAKTITLLATNWVETNRSMLRNRRIGLSMTGIAQFVANRGVDKLKQWMEDGFEIAKKYDKIYSEWFAIPESIKITTIKPSGTLSLLAGSTPGIHYPESKYYIRRIRLANNSSFIPALKEAGYLIEPAVGQEESTLVVEFPVSIGDNVRTLKEVSMWEQLSLAALAQRYWADNSVSVTITFDPKTEGNQIENALNYYQYQLKAVSFLPQLESGAYAQMPYEEITKEKYEDMVSKLTPLDFSGMFSEEAIGERYCSNDTCSIM